MKFVKNNKNLGDSNAEISAEKSKSRAAGSCFAGLLAECAIT
jgi:hypothetical protein